MAVLWFVNKQSTAVKLIVEPWAQSYEVPAGGEANIEFPDAPPPDLQFSIEENGDALIFVNTEYVKIHVNGEEHEYGFGRRAPALPPGMRW